MNEKSVFCFILCFLIVVSLSNAYNILGIFHFPAKSTMQTFTPLLKKLTENGHNLTLITNYSPEGMKENYKEILIGGADIVRQINVFTDIRDVPQWRYLSYFGPSIIDRFNKRVCSMLFESEDIRNLLKKNQKFDLIILQIFQTECVYQLAKQFDSPIIGVHSTVIMSWSAERFALSLNPSYIPSCYMPAPTQMTFLERLENTVLIILHHLYYKLVMLPADEEIVRKYHGDNEASRLRSLVYNTSLFLVNTHYTVNPPRPLVPNVIEVGGIHIGKRKSLPQDIEKWINESEHGVIYFSFGSLVRGHTMPAEKRQAFINAFKRLPQRVIWKWENETMEGKTDNIFIGKWMPQFDILSHPNVKAFISHGGLLGTFEAVHCGVPVLTMPQFGDQHTNAKALESVGGGEILYLSDATEDKIYNSLKKILSPSFQQQAKELSERFRDRPMSPLDTAIYWVEYVARHKGAHFMKTAAVGMPFYQYYLLDVIGFILAVLITFFYISYLILRSLFRLVFKKKLSSNKKVKKS